jgi:hypothetical protein
MNAQISIELDVSLRRTTQHTQPPRFTVAWDDQSPDFNFKCRTQQPGWSSVDNPPAVWRFSPHIMPIAQPIGEHFVNLGTPHDWKAAIIAVNGGDVRKWEYLIDPDRATYNRHGWPKQSYLVFSGNRLQGERVGEWFRFETLKPSDLPKVAGMTIETHPHFVHRFTCVTWDPQTRTTKHINSTGTARGTVYQFVVSYEGFGYIPWRNVVAE